MLWCGQNCKFCYIESCGRNNVIFFLNKTIINFIFSTHGAYLYSIHISLLVFKIYSRSYKMAPLLLLQLFSLTLYQKKEHQDEAERLGTKKFTRATRTDSEFKQTKSSIADHVTNENHLINWEESSILAKDSERNTRWIRESIWVRRKRGNNKSILMNADEGPINSVTLYDQLIQRAS